MNIIKQKIHTFDITSRILDLILLFLAARGAIIIERIYNGKSWGGLDPHSFNFYALFYIFIIWLILIQIFEYDLIYSQKSYWHILQNTVILNFIGVATTITLDFILKTDFFKRSTIVYFGILSYIFLLSKRTIMKHFLSFTYQAGVNPKNILIIGSKNKAERLIYEFREHREYGIHVAAILDPDPMRMGKLVAGMRVSGDMELFKRQVRELKINDVFFTINPKDIQNIDVLFRYMDIIGINYHLILDKTSPEKFPTIQRIKPLVTNYYGISMLSYYALEPNNFNN